MLKVETIVGQIEHKLLRPTLHKKLLKRCGELGIDPANDNRPLGFELVEKEEWLIALLAIKKNEQSLNKLTNKVKNTVEQDETSLPYSIIKLIPQSSDWNIATDTMAIIRSVMNAGEYDTVAMAQEGKRISCVEQSSLFTILYNSCAEDGSTATMVPYQDMADYKNWHAGVLIQNKNGEIISALAPLTGYIVPLSDLSNIKKCVRNAIPEASQFEIAKRTAQIRRMIDAKNKAKRPAL